MLIKLKLDQQPYLKKQHVSPHIFETMSTQESFFASSVLLKLDNLRYTYIFVTCGKTNKRILSTIKSCHPPFIYRSNRLCWHTTWWHKWTTSVMKCSTTASNISGWPMMLFYKKGPKALFMSSSKVVGVLPSPNDINAFYYVSAVLTWTCQQQLFKLKINCL